jgi:hypothetical protein
MDLSECTFRHMSNCRHMLFRWNCTFSLRTYRLSICCLRKFQ